MSRTFVSGKLHGVTVTDASLDYNGSVGISFELLDAADIAEYEQVHVINLNTGDRWVTYAIGIEAPGQFTLNGGGARLGVIGDRCVVLAYQTTHDPAADVAFLSETNDIIDTIEYR